MTDTLNVNIAEAPDGTYSATVAEYPDIAVYNAKDLDQLRQALEIAIADSRREAGISDRPVALPPLKLGGTSSFDDES